MADGKIGFIIWDSPLYVNVTEPSYLLVPNDLYIFNEIFFLYFLSCFSHLLFMPFMKLFSLPLSKFSDYFFRLNQIYILYPE